MTGETENLVLDWLRGMRADATAFRYDMEKRATVVEVRLGAIEDRLDAIGTRLEGWRYAAAAASGPLATDSKNHGTRVAAREGTPA